MKEDRGPVGPGHYGVPSSWPLHSLSMCSVWRRVDEPHGPWLSLQACGITWIPKEPKASPSSHVWTLCLPSRNRCPHLPVWAQPSSDCVCEDRASTVLRHLPSMACNIWLLISSSNSSKVFPDVWCWEFSRSLLFSDFLGTHLRGGPGDFHHPSHQLSALHSPPLRPLKPSNPVSLLKGLSQHCEPALGFNP